MTFLQIKFDAFAKISLNSFSPMKKQSDWWFSPAVGVGSGLPFYSFPPLNELVCILI